MFRSFAVSAACLLTLAAAPSAAQIIIPANNLGTDGALVVTSGTRTIPLGAAPTGNWEDAGDGRGIYDPEKWAVVFKYSSVSITAGATVNFANHPSGAPVVWLVDGDVTIAGFVNLDGKPGGATTLFAEPGPGGFKGGAGGGNGGSATSGFGPGGGQRGNGGGGGSYGTRGQDSQGLAGLVYGTDDIVPLIGGSGGGPRGNQGGGAGGGGILIVATGTIYLDFNSAGIYARGGSGQVSVPGPGGGSGGAIRLVCDRYRTQVNSVLDARGGGGSSSQGSVNFGGMGRIRIEANHNEGLIATTPPASFAAVGSVARIWPEPSEPRIEAVSLGNQSVPADPRGVFTLGNTDIQLSDNVPAIITINAANVPVNSYVEVRVVPVTQNQTEIRTQANFISGDFASSTWRATLPISDGVAAFTVTVTLP